MEWIDDRASRKGAALAFYTVFSLAPILILSIAIAGLFFGPEAARGEIFAQVRDLLGKDGALADPGDDREREPARRRSPRHGHRLS